MSEGLNERSAAKASKGPALIVVDYNPAWPRAFGTARAEILEAVGSFVECVRHVGDASVEGLAARPIVDILVGVHDWNQARVTIAPYRIASRRLHRRTSSIFIGNGST